MNLKSMAWAVVACVAMPGFGQIATEAVKVDFEKRTEEVAPAYLRIFDRELTDEQRDALRMLYAYMPLPDMADNSGEFFLENVDMALKARREMPWGASVPDREWRHFVLPVRINNEYLDGHRRVFYDELKDRVKGLSMADAILEINHWCHEKATYQPSDSRTRTPLQTVSAAIGRCGEESTFTVAALRAMGIPARQIYTPRWAHTDDNHAWVEAWADGKWYFLGACEPEPVLNLGWFNAPASRGMMMNTRVFGNYDGPEEVLSRPSLYTEINVTENYAPVDTVFVTVTDVDGTPVAGADVSYRLYNYAEFYPIATKKSDVSGRSSLTAGLGDLLVWATDGKDFGFAKASVGKDREVTVKIDRTGSWEGTEEFDIVPPAVSDASVKVRPEMAAENDRRKVYEDSLRGAYESTFMSPEEATRLAGQLGLDDARVTKVMTDARGNHVVVREFLESVPESDRMRALSLLEVISEKDRGDITAEVLRDHINSVRVETPLYAEYVLSPRVSDEALTPFRAYFAGKVTPARAEEWRSDPRSLVAYVARNIKIIPDWYPAGLRMSPEAVGESGVANGASRDIYFVAAARSAGIPARIDPVTGKTQWAGADGKWNDAAFDRVEETAAARTGTLRLSFEKTGRIDDPKYYTHFSLSKIENGRPRLLGYPEDGTWSGLFRDGAELDEGQYMLVSGQRLADGGVLSRVTVFNVKANATEEIPLVMRQDGKSVQVIGNFNSENTYRDIATGADKSVLSTTGRGYYVIGLITPNHEPTNHALRDIAALAPEFEKWGRGMVLLFKDDTDASRFDASMLPALPSTATFGIDTDGRIAAEIIGSLGLTEGDRPVFIIADTFNRVVFVSQGYTIGLGDRIIDTVHKLKE